MHLARPSAALETTHSVRLNRLVVESTITAALGGLLFGFDTAVVAGVTSALTSRFHLTATSLGFTVAIALWGTLLGAATGGWAGDRFGRRYSLRVLAVLFAASALGCAFSWDWASFVVFRFVAGIAIGASSVVGPMYIAEIAPAQWRGRMVGCFQLNIVFGILVALLLELPHRHLQPRPYGVALEGRRRRHPGHRLLPHALPHPPQPALAGQAG